MATVLFETVGELPATAVICKSLKKINCKSGTVFYRLYVPPLLSADASTD